MRNKLIPGCIIVVLLVLASQAPPMGSRPSEPTNPSPRPTAPEVSSVDAEQPMGAGSFVENLGQYGPLAGRLYAIGEKMSVSFGRSWMAYHIATGDEGPGRTVRVTFPGSNDVEPRGTDVTRPTMSFLGGDGPEDCFMGARSYRVVVYEDLWNGVSLRYRFAGGMLKYEFEVDLGTDASVIGMRYDGADRLTVDPTNGDLVIAIGNDLLRDAAPTASQGSDGREREVDCRYDLLDRSTVGFHLGARDRSQKLLIDPGIVFSTFIGGTSEEYVTAMWVDEVDGYTLVAGNTRSLDFPMEPPGFIHSDCSTEIKFLVRMNENASEIEYVVAFFLNQFSDIMDIFVDDVGCVFLTGFVFGSSYPTTDGAYMPSRTGSDAFLTKLDSTGTELLYSTRFGGNGSSIPGGNAIDRGLRVRVDSDGCAYVLGSTQSLRLPVTDDAAMSSLQGENDLFLAKFDPNGSSLEYSTYLGGNDADYGFGLELDDKRRVYIAGYTDSTDLVPTPRAISYRHNGMKDVFLARLDLSGAGLDYLTYIGGHENDILADMDIDSGGYLYLVGKSSSTDFPTSDGTFDEGTNISDGFAMKLDTSDWSVVYSTFLGGSTGLIPRAVSADPLGRAVIAGDGPGRGLPTTDDAFCSTLSDDAGMFIMVLDPTGSHLSYATYLGGESDDWMVECRSPVEGVIYVAGHTLSPNYPTTEGAFCTTVSGGWDAFITKFDISPPTADAGPDLIVGLGDTVPLNSSGSSDNLEIINWTWSVGTGGQQYFGEIMQFTPDRLGEFNITLTVTDVAGLVASDGLRVTVVDDTPPVAVAGDDRIVDQGERVTLDASSSTDDVGIAGWEWTFSYNGTLVTVEEEFFEWTFEFAGDHWFDLTVRDAVGNEGRARLLVRVRDTTPPVPAGLSDRTVDQHEVVTLDGSGSSDNMGVRTWNWTFHYRGGEEVLTGEVVEFTFDVVAEVVINLSVEDAAGNSNGTSFVLTVRDTEPPVLPPLDDIQALVNEVVVLNASSVTDNVAPVKWSWVLLKGGKSTEYYDQVEQVIFTSPGDVQVTLTVADVEGNEVNGTFVIRVRDVEGHELLWVYYLLTVIIVLAIVATSWMIVGKRRS